MVVPREEGDGRLLRAQHRASTLALCICTFTHSYNLISVFPYSGFMAMRLIPTLTSETAGTYAGLVSSAFMVGRAMTSYHWGRLADMYGRTTVLYTSLGLSGVWMLLFGLSRTFATALLSRFMLGLSNGIMVVAKTSVSELAGDDKELETSSMSLVLGMWGFGFLICPALGGALAEPLEQYDNWKWLQESYIKAVLEKYPFILPNLLGAFFCVIAMVSVHFYVKETLPMEKRQSVSDLPADFAQWLSALFVRRTPEKTSLLGASTPELYQSTSSKIRNTTSFQGKGLVCPDVDSITISPHTARNTQDGSIAYFWSQQRTRNHLLIDWFGCFAMIALDEGFPLFCLSQTGGLGLSERSIGNVLSVSGIIFAATQYHVHEIMVRSLGSYGAMRISSLLWGPLVALVPLSLYIQKKTVSVAQASDEKTFLSPSTFWFLVVLLAAFRVLGLTFFSSMTVAINRTVPSEHRGTVNGLATLGGSVAKGLGPVFAGVLVTLSFLGYFGSATMGAVVLWLVLGSFFVITSISTFGLREEIARSADTLELAT